MKKNEKKNETINDRCFAVILNRKPSATGVRLEIRNRHFARRQKRADAREQTEGDKPTTGEFNDAGDNSFGIVELSLSSEHAEKFLRAMTGEQQADNQSHDRINRIRVAVEEVHDRKSLRMSILRCGSSRLTPPNHCVDAPASSAIKDDEQEKPAIEDS